MINPAWHARGHRFESVILHVDFEGFARKREPFFVGRFKYGALLMPTSHLPLFVCAYSPSNILRNKGTDKMR